MALKPRFNPQTLVGAVKQLKQQDASRVMPLARGGETPTLQTYRTDISTYFTVPSPTSQMVYTAETWVTVKLTLETAGPVAVGTNAQIAPVLSGKGRLLDTGVEYTFHLARGSSLYIAAEAVNRVSFTVEPIPWAEQIAAEISAVARVVSATVQAIGQTIVGAIGQYVGGNPAPVTNADNQTMAQLAVPRLPKAMAARLTSVLPGRKVK